MTNQSRLSVIDYIFNSIVTKFVFTSEAMYTIGTKKFTFVYRINNSFTFNITDFVTI